MPSVSYTVGEHVVHDLWFVFFGEEGYYLHDVLVKALSDGQLRGDLDVQQVEYFMELGCGKVGVCLTG